jgi:hypothetical protein
MLLVINVLFEVEDIVDVDDVYDCLNFVGSDSCVVGRSGVLEAG